MKTQPTTAPWSIGCARIAKLEQIVIQSQETKAEVCRLPALSRADGVVNARAGEIAANAQLIAAAPTLAEALKSAEESLSNLAVIAKASGYPGDYQQAIATARTARAALAAAGVLS